MDDDPMDREALILELELEVNQAYDDGYDQGYVDGFDQGRVEGYSEGFKNGEDLNDAE